MMQLKTLLTYNNPNPNKYIIEQLGINQKLIENFTDK